jgi:hypothetical protein
MGSLSKRTIPLALSFNRILIAVGLLFNSASYLSADIAFGNGKAAFLFSGLWQPQDSIANKLDLKYTLALAELSIRALLLDTRPCPFSDIPQENNPKVFAGIYHLPTNSRILVGPLIEIGLLQNCSAPSLGKVPYAEEHTRSSVDLDTAIKTTTAIHRHITLGTSSGNTYQAYSLVTIDSVSDWVVLGGWRNNGEHESELRLEGFLLSQSIPERTSSTWFSEAPPLPQRTSSMVAFSSFLKNESATICADGVWSRTQFTPQGFYGNTAFKIQRNPWSIEFALDSTNGVYIGRNKKESPSFFRNGVKIEKRIPKFGSIEAAYSSRALSIVDFPYEMGFSIDIERDESLEQNMFHTFSISADRAVEGPLTTRRDIREKIMGEIAVGLKPFTLKMQAGIYRKIPIDQNDGLLRFFPITENRLAEAGADLSSTASGKFGPLSIKAMLGMAVLSGKPLSWNGMMQGSIKLEGGSLAITYTADEFPKTGKFSMAYQLKFGK